MDVNRFQFYSDISWIETAPETDNLRLMIRLLLHFYTLDQFNLIMVLKWRWKGFEENAFEGNFKCYITFLSIYSFFFLGNIIFFVRPFLRILNQAS